MLIFVAFAAVATLAFTLWVQAVRAYYRPRERRLTPRWALCADGWQIAIYHRPAAKRRFVEPVLLCHGLSANHCNFEFEPPYSIAHYLAEAGFDCFTVDWRGAGASRRGPSWRSISYCADDQIDYDAPALVQLAIEQTGANRALWVGHSLGGLIGLAAAQGPLSDKLAGLVTLGAPVFFHRDPRLQAAVRLGATMAWPYRLRHQVFSASIAPFLGYMALPLTEMIINPRHIPAKLQRRLYARLISSVSRGTLLQLKDWVFNDAFRSFDRKRDYRAGIRHLAIPLLVIGGSGDRLAPVAQVRAAYELAGSSDKTLIIFGREMGCAQDYGHGDLIFGEGAPTEIYPVLRNWLIARATNLG